MPTAVLESSAKGVGSSGSSSVTSDLSTDTWDPMSVVSSGSSESVVSIDCTLRVNEVRSAIGSSSATSGSSVGSWYPLSVLSGGSLGSLVSIIGPLRVNEVRCSP